MDKDKAELKEVVAASEARTFGNMKILEENMQIDKDESDAKHENNGQSSEET